VALPEENPREPVPVAHAAGWQAELRLRFAVAPPAGVTRLVERHHRGPLVIQRPFHPEGDPCHAYIVHPPGGVVGGDELRIDVEVEAGAHALLTTPAATKFYRCDDRLSRQVQELRAAGAVLEWLPQENIFYRGATVRAATRVHLDARSKFIGWEIACLGLPARGDAFDAGALWLDLELWRERDAPNVATLNAPARERSIPVFLDRLRLSGHSPARHAGWGLAGATAIGTLLATPATAADVARVRDIVAAHPAAGVSLVDGVLVLRALAAQGETLRNLFTSVWSALRPGIIGRQAVAPRIWAT
jgi:urease accessory protein